MEELTIDSHGGSNEDVAGLHNLRIPLGVNKQIRANMVLPVENPAVRRTVWVSDDEEIDLKAAGEPLWSETFESGLSSPRSSAASPSSSYVSGALPLPRASEGLRMSSSASTRSSQHMRSSQRSRLGDRERMSVISSADDEALEPAVLTRNQTTIVDGKRTVRGSVLNKLAAFREDIVMRWSEDDSDQDDDHEPTDDMMGRVVPLRRLVNNFARSALRGIECIQLQVDGEDRRRRHVVYFLDQSLECLMLGEMDDPHISVPVADIVDVRSWGSPEDDASYPEAVLKLVDTWERDRLIAVEYRNSYTIEPRVFFILEDTKHGRDAFLQGLMSLRKYAVATAIRTRTTQLHRAPLALLPPDRAVS